MPPISWTNSTNGIRLDLFLVQQLPGTSRRQLAILCREGGVLVNGRNAPPGMLLRVGDEISVEQLPETARARPELVAAEGGPSRFIRVVFEDDDLLVVEKPRLIHSVVLRSNDPITVADAIAAYCPNATAASPNPAEGGLVQRLDFSTSGLLTAAKHSEAWTRLHRMMIEGGTKKKYLALVEGNLSDETLHLAYEIRPAQGREKVIARPVEASHPADVVVVRRLKEFSTSSGTTLAVVEISGASFRRHQVRAYLAAAGHPLVGDTLYGCSLLLEKVDQLAGQVREGFLLHASDLVFPHPFTQQPIALHSTSSEFALILGAEDSVR